MEYKSRTMQSIPVFSLLIVASMLVWSSFTKSAIPSEIGRIATSTDSLKIDAPLAVKEIIQAKCYDCHAEGGDEEAMKDLLWDEFPSLHPEDQMYLLDDMVESIEDKEMPPPDHLKEHPEDKLTRQEARLLIEWAAALAEKLDEG